MTNNLAGQKKILLTGARSFPALELARQLEAGGHEVYAADTSSMHVARFSKCITGFFEIPSPRFDEVSFIDALVKIVNKEKIDLLIPVWEEVLYLSRHLDKFPQFCRVFCSPFSLVHELHNKWLFVKKMESLGIQAPRTQLVRTHEEFLNLDMKRPLMMKACYSRASHNVIKIDGNKTFDNTITSDNPWIAQEFLEGKHFCTYSIAFNGHLQAHSCYPVMYTLDGNSCLTFEAVDHPDITAWVQHFIRKTGYNGQAAFDFIEVPERGLFAIECNPRATSGLHLFRNEDQLAHAFFSENNKTIFAKQGTSQQIAIGMLLYGWRTALKEKKFSGYLKKFLTTKDVIYNSSDLKPFILEPLVLLNYWYKSLHKGMALPTLFTHDLDWNSSPEEK